MLGLEWSPCTRSAASHTAQPGLLLRKIPTRMRRALSWRGGGLHSPVFVSRCENRAGVAVAPPSWHPALTNTEQSRVQYCGVLLCP